MMLLDSFLGSASRTLLSNGLTLLTREHKGCGVVAINTWVKAGYFHEPDQVAGMAHLFEHMFFKGSKSFPGAEEIAQHVSSLGGSTNAGTIYDSTNYYFVLPKEGFVRGVEIQADAIINPLFDPDELKREAEVVIEESNRKLDNPPALAVERMFEIAFTAHRMKRWRIGSNEVLRNIRRDHLLAFFETLYRPSNIIVTIVGDVGHQEALEAVTATFGQLEAGSLRKERGPSEPPQQGIRFGQSFADITQTQLVFGWHTPGEGHRDAEALDLLSSILASGRSSRLYRAVVGPDGASSVGASSSVFEDVGIFTIRATLEDGNLQPVEQQVIGQIERLQSEGPSEYELQMARNKVEAGFLFELEDVLGQAQTLSYYESRGGYEDVARYLARIESMSLEEIRAAAARYLVPENLTVYHYRPTLSVASDEELVKERIIHGSRPATESAQQLPAPELALPLSHAAAQGPLQQFILSNGIPLLVREIAGAPTVSASIYFRGGRLHEQSGVAGITQLMARSMRRGTSSRSGEEVDREIEFLGTQLGIVLEEDYFGFALDVISKYLPAASALLADVILNPSFPEEGIRNERHLQAASIRRALDSAGERPFQLLYQALYGNHPYALPDTGTLTSIEGLERDSLVEWWQREVVADDAVMIVAGDISASEVRELFERQFAALPSRQVRKPPVPPVVFPAGPLEVVEVRERKQSATAIAFPAVPPQHPDWIPLRLLQDVVSGLAGTFFAELRGRRSLAYTVFAGESSRELAGAFVGYIASEASKEKEARQGLLEEMQRLAEDGIREEDVARARSYLAGSMKIRLQTNSAIARDIAQNLLYGLGTDFTDRFLARVRTLQAEDLRAVAKKYLTGHNWVMATLRGKG
jgi:zinc protease